jgi:hypothetical protein
VYWVESALSRWAWINLAPHSLSVNAVAGRGSAHSGVRKAASCGSALTLGSDVKSESPGCLYIWNFHLTVLDCWIAHRKAPGLARQKPWREKSRRARRGGALKRQALTDAPVVPRHGPRAQGSQLRILFDPPPVVRRLPSGSRTCGSKWGPLRLPSSRGRAAPNFQSTNSTLATAMFTESRLCATTINRQPVPLPTTSTIQPFGLGRRDFHLSFIHREKPQFHLMPPGQNAFPQCATELSTT